MKYSIMDFYLLMISINGILIAKLFFFDFLRRDISSSQLLSSFSEGIRCALFDFFIGSDK